RRTSLSPTSSPRSSPSYRSLAETSTQEPTRSGLPRNRVDGVCLSAYTDPMRIAAATSTLLVCAACSHNTIPGTQIRDAPENRAILDVLAAYKAAMEARDANALL